MSLVRPLRDATRWHGWRKIHTSPGLFVACIVFLRSRKEPDHALFSASKVALNLMLHMTKKLKQTDHGALAREELAEAKAATVQAKMVKKLLDEV